MIVRKRLDPIIIVKRTWKRVLSLTVVAVAVTIAHRYFEIKNITVDSLPASILGVAIAFLIGFRVNSAYERWWEARKIWGAIVNDSRSITRQIISFGGGMGEQGVMVKQMVHRQIAFVYALKNTLRKTEIFEEIKQFVHDDELTWLQTQKNVPNALLQKQAMALADMNRKGYIDDFRHMQIDFKLSALCDSMGAGERIKNTVFPRQYSFYSTFFVTLYTHLLPFVFVNQSGWVSIPSTIIIGFIFYALDSIASGIENPFENTLNDIPMSAICRTIEINLKQQLGETELPPVVEPVNGFLF
ncbi:MAG TPA: bestrophin family ion channel [Flavobacteriales bacterium]|nr:bestrophin family ion channel [Flavobacteriales bacterium]